MIPILPKENLVVFPKKDLQGKICLSPFTTIEVDIQGNVRLCECAAWMPSLVGNLFQQSIQEILSNQASCMIRSSISQGTYEFCDQDRCGVLARGLETTLSQIGDRHQKIIKDPRSWVMPHIIRIAGDTTCNLSCPSCRTGVIKVGKDQQQKQQQLGSILKKNLFGMPSDDLIIMHVSTSGEIFASPMLLQFVQEIPVEDFPNLGLYLQTNGLLAEKNWHRLGELQHHVKMTTITTDAASRSVYEKLRRGGKWQDCQRALHFLAYKKTQNGMRLNMRMVVQKSNYHEIPAFYDLAKSTGADLVEYSRLTDWGTWSRPEFLDNDVFDPAHAEFGRAQQVLDQIKHREDVFLCGGLS
jgi:MoaA/NifB/PqqE/SkfB family radical SAM enzyme